MATRTWNGATADWTTDADWAPATPGTDVPLPGDTAVVASGTVILTRNVGPDALLENNQVTLGGAVGATLLLRNPLALGRRFSVTIAGNATIEADGVRGFAGSITSTQTNGTITLKGDAGGELVLLNGGALNLQATTVDFEGAVTLERSALIQGDIVNNGTLSIRSGATTLATETLSGTGTIEVGSTAALTVNGSVAATQTVAFDGTGGTLVLSSFTAPTFGGVIQNFAPGDVINFTPNDQVSSAAIDTTTHRLTIVEDTGQTYVLNNFFGQAGTLSVAHPASRKDVISYASALPQLNYQIDASARAINAAAARATLVPGTTTHVTGAGVKVGIISDSYNIAGTASADIAAGYLPASGVTVLREGAAGDTDEGRAMAELIHQVAPDALLYFASADGGVVSLAASVQALQAAGCTVIVDDVGLDSSEPFFQLGSPAQTAVANAITSGVTYVASAGNDGDAYFDHAFTSTQQILLDGSVAAAFTFSNGTPYQSITINGGVFATIDLQWDAPFYGVGGAATDQPYSIAFKIFDALANTLVGTSYQVNLGGHLVSEAEFRFQFNSGTTNYRIAIYQNDPAQTVGRVKYLLGGVATGAGSGGRINDPEAGVGSGTIAGHALVPGLISVGAIDVANTPAAGVAPTFNDYFSAFGPGTLLFDSQGNRLAQPVTVGSPVVTAPDGSYTSVSGFAPFFGTSASAPNVAGVAALIQQAVPGISPENIATALAESAQPLSGASTATAGAGLVQADRALALAEQVACYCKGTLILTDTGDRPIETLAIGDRVVTATGASMPIRWIGRRSYASRFLRGRPHLLPVTFRAGSLAEGVPRRDLCVSPQHAMLIDGMLIPAVLLVNGTSIVQGSKADRVEYIHVELDVHDAILAEGAASETFVDDGSRFMFHNAAEFAALYPGEPATQPQYCAPRIESGWELQVIRVRLLARALGETDPRGCSRTISTRRSRVG